MAGNKIFQGTVFLFRIVGINAIMYYAPEILKMVSGSSGSVLFQSTFIGVVFVCTSLLALCLIDRVGCRPMLILVTRLHGWHVDGR